MKERSKPIPDDFPEGFDLLLFQLLRRSDFR
jgi:hypothetical protein